MEPGELSNFPSRREKNYLKAASSFLTRFPPLNTCPSNYFFAALSHPRPRIDSPPKLSSTEFRHGKMLVLKIAVLLHFLHLQMLRSSSELTCFIANLGYRGAVRWKIKGKKKKFMPRSF